MAYSVLSITQLLVLSALASLLEPLALASVAQANSLQTSSNSPLESPTRAASEMPAPTTPAPATNSFTPINSPILGVSDLESAPLGNLSTSPASSTLGQITSVTQLSDVQPTDWAYQALQSLVERYGCIVGYPDSTYRGNNALTRFEFAAGLNACLDRINEIIASGLADVATREDLETVQRLQEEFAAELAMLRGRVDVLEARTEELEANQFSTTTKLNGEVIFSIAAASGAYPGASDPDATPAILSYTDGAPGDDAQFAFFQRTRLNLTTSFTGSDLLITGLQSYNYLSDPSSIQGTLGYTDVLGLNASQVRLNTESQFPGINPQTFTPNTANDFRLYKLLYIFPSGLDNLTLFAGTNAETTDAFPAITPFASDTQGAISRFAGYNAAVRVSGGTSRRERA